MRLGRSGHEATQDMSSPEDTPADSHDSPSEGPGRVRVSIACQYCRSRKIKCNGETPCNKCVEADINCKPGAKRKKRAPSRKDQYIRELEKKVHELQTLRLGSPGASIDHQVNPNRSDGHIPVPLALPSSGGPQTGRGTPQIEEYGTYESSPFLRANEGEVFQESMPADETYLGVPSYWVDHQSGSVTSDQTCDFTSNPWLYGHHLRGDDCDPSTVEFQAALPPPQVFEEVLQAALRVVQKASQDRRWVEPAGWLTIHKLSASAGILCHSLKVKLHMMDTANMKTTTDLAQRHELAALRTLEGLLNTKTAGCVSAAKCFGRLIRQWIFTFERLFDQRARDLNEGNMHVGEHQGEGSSLSSPGLPMMPHMPIPSELTDFTHPDIRWDMVSAFPDMMDPLQGHMAATPPIGEPAMPSGAGGLPYQPVFSHAQLIGVPISATATTGGATTLEAQQQQQHAGLWTPAVYLDQQRQANTADRTAGGQDEDEDAGRGHSDIFCSNYDFQNFNPADLVLPCWQVQTGAAGA